MFASQETAESEAVPVAFRYNVGPVTSFWTQVFRPKGAGGAELKSATLGTVYISKYELIPESKLVDVLGGSMFCFFLHSSFLLVQDTIAW